MLKMAREKSKKQNNGLKSSSRSDKEGFYIRVQRPIEIRRQVLLSSKGIIEGLKGYEKLKAIREERFKKIEEFKDVMKEIQAIVNRIKNLLPHHDLPSKSTVALKRQESINHAIKRTESRNDVLLKLEKELAEIESRLNSI